MNPTDVLKAALAAVLDAKIPDDLREVAFSRAIDLTIGVVPAAATPETPSSGSPSFAATSSTGLARVAEALAVPADRIEMLFIEHDDAIQVVVDPGRLGSSMKERVKAIALLLAAGRQLGGWDDGPTSDAVIRAEVDRLGVYDNTNYSKQVKDLTAWFNVNGSGRSATYKLKFQGREYLQTFAKGLIEG